MPNAVVQAGYTALRNHPFTAGWSEEQLVRLAECSFMRTFTAGSYLWRQGDRPDCVYLICAGEAALEITLPGQGPVQIEIFGPGELLGEPWRIAGQRMEFDARAASEVSTLSVDGNCLRRQFLEDYKLAYDVLNRYAALTTGKLEAARLRLLGLDSQRARAQRRTA